MEKRLWFWEELTQYLVGFPLSHISFNIVENFFHEKHTLFK